MPVLRVGKSSLSPTTTRVIFISPSVEVGLGKFLHPGESALSTIDDIELVETLHCMGLGCMDSKDRFKALRDDIGCFHLICGPHLTVYDLGSFL